VNNRKPGTLIKTKLIYHKANLVLQQLKERKNALANDNCYERPHFLFINLFLCAFSLSDTRGW